MTFESVLYTDLPLIGLNHGIGQLFVLSLTCLCSLQCSAECGMGIRTRGVLCLTNHISSLPLEGCGHERPTDSQVCNHGPCESRIEWFTAPWSQVRQDNARSNWACRDTSGERLGWGFAADFTDVSCPLLTFLLMSHVSVVLPIPTPKKLFLPQDRKRKSQMLQIHCQLFPFEIDI